MYGLGLQAHLLLVDLNLIHLPRTTFDENDTLDVGTDQLVEKQMFF